MKNNSNNHKELTIIIIYVILIEKSIKKKTKKKLNQTIKIKFRQSDIEIKLNKIIDIFV